MTTDENLYKKLRRFFLISNITIVALIGVTSTIIALLASIENIRAMRDYLVIGLALTIPGWTFLILYGWGCYDVKDWRRTISAVLAALQIIVFLILLSYLLLGESPSFL